MTASKICLIAIKFLFDYFAMIFSASMVIEWIRKGKSEWLIGMDIALFFLSLLGLAKLIL